MPHFDLCHPFPRSPFSQPTPSIHKTGWSRSCCDGGRSKQTGSENPERPGAQVRQSRSHPSGGWSEEAIPLLVLPGPLRAACSFSIPPTDGGRLLASPATVEQQGWPMDLPESPAGGPDTQSRWLGPCLPRGNMKREQWVNGQQAVARGLGRGGLRLHLGAEWEGGSLQCAHLS